MSTTIWWIRRDLRLEDNPALNAALRHGQPVLPVFILDPVLLARPAGFRQAFLFDGLRALDHRLKALGSRLIVRQGTPAKELSRLQEEASASVILAQEDFSPYARRRDAAVGAALPLELFNGQTIHHPAALVRANGRPYSVFTPFSKAWKALPFPGKPVPAPLARFLPAPPLASIVIPDTPALPNFPAGEAEAQKRLSAFLNGPIFCYPEERNRLDRDATSSLSPYLRFGMLSPRQAAWAVHELAMRSQAVEEQDACAAWLIELIWRDFFAAILYHFPHVLHRPFNPAYNSLPWSSDQDQLRAWQEGLTGYPLVDACMRQLVRTGWISNRGRMLVASFLVKDLLLDWRLGEDWFMQHLVDGDPASNNGNWQWCAGVGADAAPYFRIFNPVSQGQKCDPQGNFVRRWLPELERVPQPFIHCPWQMPAGVQQQTGCRIGIEYPAPLVDHAFARQRAISTYTQAYQRKSVLETKNEHP